MNKGEVENLKIFWEIFHESESKMENESRTRIESESENEESGHYQIQTHHWLERNVNMMTLFLMIFFKSCSCPHCDEYEEQSIFLSLNLCCNHKVGIFCSLSSCVHMLCKMSNGFSAFKWVVVDGGVGGGFLSLQIILPVDENFPQFAPIDETPNLGKCPLMLESCR